MEVNELIAEARKSAGLTQVELAVKLGIGEKTYRNWEGGHVVLNTAKRNRLAETLGFDDWDALNAKHGQPMLFSVARGRGRAAPQPDDPADRFARHATEVGMQPRDAANRLMDWFCEQNDTIQRGVLGLLPPSVAPDIARLVLERMASEEKASPDSTGEAKNITIIKKPNSKESNEDGLNPEITDDP